MSKKITKLSITALFGMQLCAASIAFGGSKTTSEKTNNLGACPTITVTTTKQTNVTCYGLSNGLAIVTATGGTAPYGYSWNTGSTSDTAKNLAAGTYTVIATDANSCTGQLIVTITQPAQLRDSIATLTNETCNGGKTGNATVGVKGGTPTYTYSWSSGSTRSSLTRPGNTAAAGTYIVIITDKDGCKDSATAIITQPAPVYDSIVVTNVACYGTKTGSVNVISTTGGTSPYTYAWNIGATTSSITGLAAGSYTLTTTDKNACTAINTETITQPAKTLAVSATSTVQATCGQSNGAAFATVSGGTSPYIFAWAASGGTNDTAKGLAAGSYTVTITDANGCNASSTTVVTDNTTLTATVTTSSNITPCYGDANGSATGSGVLGTAPYTYKWMPGGSTNATISSLSAGTYTLTVTDNAGCIATTIANITQPAAVRDSIATSTAVTCYGGSNGSATIGIKGGTSPYTYLWSNGATSSTVSTFKAGTYSVTATDANGCTASATVTITQGAAIRDSISSQINETCYGGATGNATVGVAGGTSPYTYIWTPGGGTASTLSTFGGFFADNNQSAGTYKVIVTDKNGCKDSATAVITQPAPVKDSIDVIEVACKGASTGSIDVVLTTGGTSPYTYKWNSGATTSSLSNLAAGSYTLTTTDKNACTATNTVTVTQPAVALAVSATSAVQATCGQSNGVAYATVTGGNTPYDFTWAATGGTNDTAKNLAAGNYTVTVTDANGCILSAATSVTDNSTLSAKITASSEVTPCYGDANGSATGSGELGTPPYTYNWTPGGATTATISNLTVGIYTLTVTDNAGCIASTTDTVTQPTQVKDSLTTSTAATCYGDSNGIATIGAKGGTSPYTYLWSNGATTSTASTLKAGTYSVTATDSKGCTATVTVSVGQAPQIRDSIATLTNETCYGGATGNATVGVKGGTPTYTYSWSSGSTRSSLTRPGNTATAGTYKVIITDKNGCKDSATATITQPAVLKDSLTDSVMVACFGSKTGSATIGVSGGTPGYTYKWAASGGSKNTASDLGAGTYTVTVSDTNKCTASPATIVVTITQPASAVTATATAYNASCGKSNGSAKVTASGGTPGYTYNWSPSGGTTDSASGLKGGIIYNCTITDANGCTYTVSANVADSSTLAATITSQTNVTPCFGDKNGTANFHVSGGSPPYTFSWSPTGGTDTTALDLAANTYTFTATDSKGCAVSDTVIITRPTMVTATISASTDVSCNGGTTGSATVTAGGGAGGYSYSWAPTGGTTANATALSAGTYTITVTDKSGCTGVDSVTIIQPSAIVDTISATEVLCNGQKNGSASITTMGGTPTYTYKWSNGSTSSSLTNIGAGTYTITIRDKNGCTATDAVTITQPAALVPIAVATNALCNGDDGTITTAGSSGGTVPYSYSWNNGDITSSISAMAGSYTVTITDANGCAASANATITQPTALVDSSTSIAATCGKSNGSATVEFYGGTPAYSILWSDGMTTNSISSLAAGSYTCTVTDANGCKLSADVIVADSSTLAGNITPSTNVTCNGLCNGSASVTASGGTSPYSYSWTDGSSVASASNLCAGLITVVIMDSKGCEVTDTITITQPAPLTITFDSTISSGCNNTATAIVSGGTGIPGYTYLWSPSGQTTLTASSLCAGTCYTVTVWDANGCTDSASICISLETGITGIRNNSSFNLYPLPARDNLNISLGSGDFMPQSIMVYDITGRELINKQVTVNSSTIIINVSKLENGTYILKLENGDNQKLARFTVVR
ncbi:MAG: T9SS type A sorting domain-containing protein [Bacteroidia bacterium]